MVKVQKKKFEVLASDPSAVEGEIYYNSVDKKLKVHNGASFESVGGLPNASEQGSVIYDNGTAYVKLSPGAEGQVLTSGGVAANPFWKTSVSALVGTAQNAYQTLQANNVFDNKNFLCAEEFVSAAGTNLTVNTSDSSGTFSGSYYTINTEINGTTPLVTIEATYVNTGANAVSGVVYKKYAPGKWVVYCTSGTNNVRRAKIMQSLFYGTNGTNQVATSTNIIGCTAIKSSTASDEGYSANLAQLITNSVASTGSVDYTGTFSNTTTNTVVCPWSAVSASTGAGSEASESFVVGGVTLNKHYRNGGGSSGVDEMGLDLTADQSSNPSTTVLSMGTGDASPTLGTCYVKAVILSKGTISFALSGGLSGYAGTSSAIDYNVTHSIPAFGLLSESIPSTVVSDTATLDLTGTESNMCIYGDVDLPVSYDATDTSIISNGTVSGYTSAGYKITMSATKYIKKVELYSANTSTQVKIYDSSFALLATSPVDLNKCAYFTGLQLTSGQSYYVEAVGGTYGKYETASFPYTRTNLSFVSGSYNGGSTTSATIGWSIYKISTDTNSADTFNTSITVDISDGTTTVSAQPFNTPIDMSSLSSGTLKLTFNLISTDPEISPRLYGWGVFLK